jgi:diguanylate cyclase (GGDEF)-like protein/PAS domain S-box-containing protein
MDGDPKFTYVSEHYQEITGLAPERLLGRTSQESLVDYIDKPEQWVQHYADLETHRPFEDVELTWMRSDGETRVLRNSGKPLFNEDGVFRGYRGVVRDVTEAHRMAEQIAHQASHDALTGLVNRHEFEQRLQRVLETARTEKTEHALCYLDLDQFKVINDTCGHAAGDELLRQLGILLREQVRDRDTLARLGGDEFGALMEHCSLHKAGRVANALRDAIQEFRFLWQGRTFSIGVSIGLVPITGASKSITAVLRAADTACYAAKDSGRNRIHIYHQEDAELTRRHREMQWVSRINQALEEDRFQLNAQPIVPVEHDDTTEGKGDHYELLLRMTDEEGRCVLPGDFMPAAEHYNLATKIDRWVVHTAFEWFARHPEHLQRLHLCAINFSSHSLGDEEFVGFVIRSFDRSSVPPKKICFEITETAAIANLEGATRCLKALKGLGCRFALDDFGSGVSSFAYLKYLPVDFLKIDGVFVKGIADNPMDLAVVKSINEIAQAMGKRTIAECVETKGILDKLKLGELGVDYAQGYYIGRPRPIEEMR